MPQMPFLIAGTLRENICYGLDREVSDEEMEEVVRRACLAEFVNGLPERFDFLVSEAGGTCREGRSRGLPLPGCF